MHLWTFGILYLKPRLDHEVQAHRVYTRPALLLVATRNGTISSNAAQQGNLRETILLSASCRDVNHESVNSIGAIKRTSSSQSARVRCHAAPRRDIRGPCGYLVTLLILYNPVPDVSTKFEWNFGAVAFAAWISLFHFTFLMTFPPSDPGSQHVSDLLPNLKRTCFGTRTACLPRGAYGSEVLMKSPLGTEETCVGRIRIGRVRSIAATRKVWLYKQFQAYAATKLLIASVMMGGTVSLPFAGSGYVVYNDNAIVTRGKGEELKAIQNGPQIVLSASVGISMY